MFTDEAKITVKAGHGGQGGRHFLREKYKPWGGPSGGDGGDGGSVYVIGKRKINSLTEFRFQREFFAPNGENGQRNKMGGKDGKDLTIQVPCGTIIRNALTKKIILDITEEDVLFLLAKGGKGGLGNCHFATSKRQAPTYAQPGLAGEELAVELELKLIADMGIVGLPNAGKSTLLKVLTNAHPKIGAYPFTTLHPNLGILRIHERDVVLADIPGLIEGASKGVGLGDEFLRHLERTTYLLHVLDMSGFSGDPLHNFRIINKELSAYSKKLLKKKQIVVLNKADVPEHEEYVKQFLAEFQPEHYAVISAAANQGIKELIRLIETTLQ